MRGRLLNVFIAACCLLALGTAATTLESTVQTNPDEVVDFDSSVLPVGADAVGDLQRKVSSQNDGSEGSAQPQSGGDDRQSEQQAQQQNREQQQKQQQQKQQQQQRSSSQQQQKSGGIDAKIEKMSLWERLLALLRSLLALLPLALVFALLAAAVAFRDRIAALLPDRESDAPDEATTRPEPTPTDDVSEAWWELMREYGLGDRRELTPRERASLAVERGAEPSAVWSLTELFEDVRYGGATPTGERRQRARDELRRVRMRGGRGA